MIALMEPAIFAVMEPVKRAAKGSSDPLSIRSFHLLFWIVFLIFDNLFFVFLVRLQKTCNFFHPRSFFSFGANTKLSQWRAPAPADLIVLR